MQEHTLMLTSWMICSTFDMYAQYITAILGVITQIWRQNYIHNRPFFADLM